MQINHKLHLLTTDALLKSTVGVFNVPQLVEVSSDAWRGNEYRRREITGYEDCVVV